MLLYKQDILSKNVCMSQNANSNNIPAPTTSPTFVNNICGLYGTSYEPLHPSTRTFKRQLMEKTISDLLVKLDYTGLKLNEMKKQCRVLQSVLAIKNEEMEALQNELLCLKKERQEIWEDYEDLNIRYQERVEELRRNRKNNK